MIVRDEKPEDFPAIRSVVTAAFGPPSEANLVDRLRADGDAVISLVAVDDGEIVGHVLFSKVKAPFPALGLGPVSVLPERQCEGIARARAAGTWAGIFVLGNPEFYRHYGFEQVQARSFESVYAGPHFMALPLKGTDLPVKTGDVFYPRAFEIFD